MHEDASCHHRAALERTGLGKSVKKLKKYVFVPQADDENAAESKEAAEKVPKLSDQLFERWKQKALEELERSENEKRTEAANKKRKLEREKKEAEKATEKEKKKAKVQLKDADDIDDVIKKQKKDVTQKETKTTTTTVTRTVVSRPAIISPCGNFLTPTTTETLKKRKAREPVASAATDATKPKQTKIGGVSASMLYNSASKESSKKIGVPSALLALQTKKEKKVKKAYFETHLPYSDDPNEVKFKHKSERDAEDGKAKPKKKKSLTWASSDELEQRKIYVPDPNDWLIKYDDKSAGMDADDDSDASVEAALKRKAREEESERNAAAKARKRKMEQMRATTSWKIPKDIPRDPELNIACGEDSRELHRIAGIVARKKAAVYKDRKEVPDSPAEAPKEKANEDEMLEIPIQLAVEPAQQQPQHQPRAAAATATNAVPTSTTASSAPAARTANVHPTSTSWHAIPTPSSSSSTTTIRRAAAQSSRHPSAVEPIQQTSWRSSTKRGRIQHASTWWYCSTTSDDDNESTGCIARESRRRHLGGEESPSRRVRLFQLRDGMFLGR